MKQKCRDGGEHDWREVYGGKRECCVKCNLARDIKPAEHSKDYQDYLNSPLDPRD